MRRRTCLAGTLALAARISLPPGVLALSGRVGTASARELAAFGGPTMATRYSVRLDAVADVDERRALGTATDAAVGAVEAAMSTYRMDSELSRFNASSGSEWYPVSRATGAVATEALRASMLSGGAFDATVGPLVNLWGFGPDGRITAAPEDQAVGRLLERVGYRNVAVRGDGAAMRKQRGDVYLDLSGVAKGYAVDEVARLLDRRGVASYLVELGGELRARGRRPDGTAWKVGLEWPSKGRRAVHRIVALDGLAIATSGDYRNFVEIDGRRYCHAIDPSTGRPVAHGLASVSVIAPTTIAADALSTALMVLGPEEGADLARRRGIAAHFLRRTPEGFAESVTPGFEARLVA